MARVLLIQMPFASLRWPSPALGLLKALAREQGHACDSVYFTFDLAERMGGENYEWIADRFAFVLGGERLFAKEYFGATGSDASSGVALPDDDAYYRETLLPEDPLFSEDDRAAYEALGRHVGPFLDDCLARVDWAAYDIIGFSSTFQQTMAAACLAQRIRRAGYDPAIVLGGAACDGPMGRALLESFPEFDYVFSGESDDAFPCFLDCIERGMSPSSLRGVIARESSSGSDAVRATPLCTSLDRLPIPDYDDYFTRLSRSPLSEVVEPLLLFETTRGCWWGQTHHCRFCGLNSDRIAYRKKSTARAVEEMAYLAERYGVDRACTTDNILDPGYFKELPGLVQEAGVDLAFEQELRTTMSRQQVNSLIKAGLAAAQLGVETFSTRILKAIDKGATALHNVRVLKWMAEAGVEVHWNFLYGFPEELPEDYDGMPDLIASLAHLPPPVAVGPVRLDRFSPYFEDPARHGIRNVRPKPAFHHVFPFDDARVRRLAYYFDFDFADSRYVDSYTLASRHALSEWAEMHASSALTYYDRPDGVLLITDTRPCAGEFQYRLRDWRREAYLLMDAGVSAERLLALLHERFHESAPTVEQLHAALGRWISQRIALRFDGVYLSLAIGRCD